MTSHCDMTDGLSANGGQMHKQHILRHDGFWCDSLTYRQAAWPSMQQPPEHTLVCVCGFPLGVLRYFPCLCSKSSQTNSLPCTEQTGCGPAQSQFQCPHSSRVQKSSVESGESPAVWPVVCSGWSKIMSWMHFIDFDLSPLGSLNQSELWRSHWSNWKSAALK